MTPEKYIMPEPQDPYFTDDDIDGVFPDAKQSKAPPPSQSPIPPYSYVAETAVLGAIMLNNRALTEVRGELTADDFYGAVHRRLFEAMLAIAARQEGVDETSLFRELEKDGSLERIGGPLAWNKLTVDLREGRAEVGRVKQYARDIQETKALRLMIDAGAKISDRGMSGPGDVGEYLSESHEAIALAAQYKGVKGPVKIGVEMRALFERLEKGTAPVGLVKTGIETIDSFTGGLWPSLLHVVAGRTGMGKTCLLGNIATNAAIAGKKVLFFTLEDSRKYLTERVASRLADIPTGNFERLKLDDAEQWRRMVDTINLTDPISLWWEDTAGLTSQAIAQMAAAHKATHGLDLLIVDHLGEVADKGESETSIAGRAVMRIRDIAKDLAIPVILASQLNRKVEDREDNRPWLSDLRQSGRIEEAARVVWLLYRPAHYVKGDDAVKHDDLHLIQAKSSHRQTGVMKLWVDLSRMHVRTWDPVTDGVWPELDKKGKYETGH